MAEAAQADGISLTLVAGYQDADTRTAAYEAQKQTYLDKRKSEEEASARAAAIQPAADANEHGTGYAADILSADYTTQDTGFAETRAYEWLTAYAAEYGFILRYPQDRQAVTGVVFEPWHWRYVGVENALAIRASGLSLEEFLALQKAILKIKAPRPGERAEELNWNVLSLRRACIFPATRRKNSTAAASASILPSRHSGKRPPPMRCCRWCWSAAMRTARI